MANRWINSESNENESESEVSWLCLTLCDPSGNSNILYFGGSKITADGDCSHEIKRCLLLGRKAITNLDSILKSKDITLSTKSI